VGASWRLATRAAVAVAEGRGIEPRLESVLVAPASDDEPGRSSVSRLKKLETFKAVLVVDGARTRCEAFGEFIATVGGNGDGVDLDDGHGLNAAMVDWFVRPVADTDSAALIELIGGIWAEYPGVELHVDAEEPWLRAPATFHAEHDGQFWVACDDETDAIIGCVGIKGVAAETVELKSLYVSKAARRTGLGSALVRLVEATAADRAARTIRLWSDSRFHDAHRLYAGLGYVSTGQERDLADLSNTTEYGFAKDLLQSLLDFSDLEGCAVVFASLAAAVPGTRFASLALAQQARTSGVRGNFAAASELLDSIKADDDPVVRGWVALERGRVANSSGAAGRGRELFDEALAIGRSECDDGLAVDAAHMIGIVGSPTEQVEFSTLGLTLASESIDPRARSLVGALLNNLGCTLGELDRWDEALAVHARAVAWREERGAAGPLAVARWQYGRALRGVGRFEDALEVQWGLDADSDPYVAEERGENLLALGRFEEARPWFAHAAEGLAADGWTAANEPDRLARLQLLAAGESVT